MVGCLGVHSIDEAKLELQASSSFSDAAGAAGHNHMVVLAPDAQGLLYKALERPVSPLLAIESTICAKICSM